MDVFTGFEYLLIEAANHFGHDKMVYADRIQWARGHIDELETLAPMAEDIPRYRKVVMAIRQAQAGLPSGHLVGFDACCSGMQLMSVMTGCFEGAKATGLIHQDVRSDAYRFVTDAMNVILSSVLEITRAKAKDAVMKTLYGSKAEPREIFGKNTDELRAFYAALLTVAPGASGLLTELLESWQSFALAHAWKLPDGYDSYVKVMDTVNARIEVDELDHATFTYQWSDNVGSKKGLSNVANVTHSVDAYVLRSLIRRCNYDSVVVERANSLINARLDEIIYNGITDLEPLEAGDEVLYYMEQFNRSGMPDVVILPHLTPSNVKHLTEEHLRLLWSLCREMLAYTPFEIVSVHDEFMCHANNMNHLRQQYNNILADLADSNILGDILGQIHGITGGTYTKLSADLSKYIRNANYALS